MTMTLRRLLFGALLVIAPSISLAYDLETHRQLTQEAIGKSGLATRFLERELGVEFSGRFINKIVIGAADEDRSLRYVNHFHDPVKNRALTHFCSAILNPVMSATWAADQSSVSAADRFDWPTARSAFLTALTEETSAARDTGFLKMFETLGHALHLVEDGAQPQHTRNDIHAGVFFGLCGPPSLIEAIVEGEGLATTIDYTRAGSIPSLGRLGDFWSTIGTTMPGRGIAEYSNRNFVTPGTNFSAVQSGNHYVDYPLPALDVSKVTVLGIRDVLGADTPEGVTGDVTFFGNIVDDRLNGTSDENRFMTTLSLFDEDLVDSGKPPRFSYNAINVREAAKFLLPRAVLYSAGVLDYFFRGSLSVGIDETANDLTAIVRNASNEPLANGVLRIYADRTNGARTPVTGPINVSAVAAGSELPDPILLDTPPADTTRFVAVDRGDLGQETASGASPGAVIGKVFNTERVEEILAGAQQWQMDAARRLPAASARRSMGDGQMG